MLNSNDVMATIAVKDLNVARKFYEEVLGLKPLPAEQDGVMSFASGKSVVLVYESQFAGTNRATAATWTTTEDVAGLVRSLSDKGVRFEHYDFPGGIRAGDVHIMGEGKAAWFKDPDGNILAIVGRG